jgi:hypothetical protein
LHRDEAIAAFSTLPLLGHEAGSEPESEVQRHGRLSGKCPAIPRARIQKQGDSGRPISQRIPRRGKRFGFGAAGPARDAFTAGRRSAECQTCGHGDLAEDVVDVAARVDDW